MRIGFLGLGVMGLPMAINVVKKSGCEVLGFDVVPKRLEEFKEAGGVPITNTDEIYTTCDVVMQMLPTHETIMHSFDETIRLAKKGTIMLDLDSTAPDIIQDYYPKFKAAGMHLIDSPVSGGNPMAIAGTLAIMSGGDKEIFDQVQPLLACMGHPVYTGKSSSGSITKLVNNMIGGAMLTAMAEGYAFAAKAGIDLQTTFDATRVGFAGGPMYDNKVPKIIARDYRPGARIAVHLKDIHNAKRFAHKMGVDTPVTDVTQRVMEWMGDNGYIDYDQAAMVKYFEDKMNVKVGEGEEQV